MSKGLKRIHTYADLVLFTHSLFGLPHAYAGAILARGGIPSLRELLWVTLAMVGARNGANALNRLVDADIDARNPRTASRHLPRGIVSKKEALALSVACLVLFVVSAWQLNPTCVKLLPVALAVLLVYSYTKRFTWASHLVLGFAVAMAPMGGWIAIRAAVEVPALLMGAAVGAWVAGFDIIYATLDIDFDRLEGLHSIPARFGLEKSLVIARALHVLSIALFFTLGAVMDLGLAYFSTMGLISALIWLEHRLAAKGDALNIYKAAYTINQVVAPVFLTGVVLDLLL
ncbi:MAG TPA: UbiA family prenyltransferase [Firmicutes bacterium]|nr:UbiA family prenyltransferase [Bacillota bacterium]